MIVPDYEMLLPALSELHGQNPQFGRLMYQCFYPNLKSPFWGKENPNHWMMLLAFLETQSTLSGFIASTLDKRDLLDLEAKVRPCLQSIDAHLAQYEECQRIEETMLFLWQLCQNTWKGQHQVDASTAVLCVLVSLYFISGLVGLANARIYNHVQVQPLENKIYQAVPSMFPKLTLHHLRDNAKILFDFCQSIRQGPGRDPRFLMQQSGRGGSPSGSELISQPGLDSSPQHSPP